MPLPNDERQFLESVNAPKHDVCVSKANDFCARTGMSVTDFAQAIGSEYGRCSRVSMLLYMRGQYGNSSPTSYRSTQFMDARVWDYCARHFPKPRDCGHSEPMLETRGCQTIRNCFEEALHEGVNSLIYGPPAAEKSFVLENLVHQRRESGHSDAIYVYCDPNLLPMSLLQRVAREAEVFVSRACTRDHYKNALIAAFDSRPYPPALIFDEAQHLPVETLEEVRALHDRTRRRNRPGCGIILAGSHNLFRDFMHPSRRPRMEQWLSRLQNREQLEGMSRAEALEIAGRAWGKRVKFNAQQEERILAVCKVADIYATDSEGRPLRDEKGGQKVHVYYSARRLLNYIRKQKKNVQPVLAAEGAA
jgi:type II secretory pathway predicted ATPase ExeA